MNAAKLGPWTDAENLVICAAYGRLLMPELQGELKPNKSAARREGLAAMAATREDNAQRSAGSWEMKACNISAVMRAAGLPWVDGYKPLGHGQAAPLARALVQVLLAHGFDDDAVNRMQALTQ